MDGIEVKPGQLVDVNSTELTIPTKGYAGIITTGGYALELRESIPVSKIIERAIDENHPPPVHDGCGSGLAIKIVSDCRRYHSHVFGDSILLLLKDNIKKGPPYVIELRNQFDKKLLVDTLFSNWKAYSLSKIMGKEKFLLIQVKAKKWETEPHSIRLPLKTAKEKLEFDLSRIPADFQNEKCFISAIYYLNQFYQDHLFLHFQLERVNYQPQSEIFSNYLAQQKKKYHFELFEFHK